MRTIRVVSLIGLLLVVSVGCADEEPCGTDMKGEAICATEAASGNCLLGEQCADPGAKCNIGCDGLGKGSDDLCTPGVCTTIRNPTTARCSCECQ